MISEIYCAISLNIMIQQAKTTHSITNISHIYITIANPVGFYHGMNCKGNNISYNYILKWEQDQRVTWNYCNVSYFYSLVLKSLCILRYKTHHVALRFTKIISLTSFEALRFLPDNNGFFFQERHPQDGVHLYQA